MIYNEDQKRALAHSIVKAAEILSICNVNPDELIHNPFLKSNTNEEFVKHSENVKNNLSSMALILIDALKTLNKKKEDWENASPDVSYYEGDDMLELDEDGGEVVEFGKSNDRFAEDLADGTWGYKDSFWRMIQELESALHALTGKTYVSLTEKNNEKYPEPESLRTDTAITRGEIENLYKSLTYIKANSQQVKELTEGYDWYLDTPEFRESIDFVLDSIDKDRAMGNSLRNTLSTLVEAGLGKAFTDTITNTPRIDNVTGEVVFKNRFVAKTGDGETPFSMLRRYKEISKAEEPLVDNILEFFEAVASEERERSYKTGKTYNNAIQDETSRMVGILKKAGLTGDDLAKHMNIYSDISDLKLSSSDKTNLEKARTNLRFYEDVCRDRTSDYFDSLSVLVQQAYIQLVGVDGNANAIYSQSRYNEQMAELTRSLKDHFGFSVTNTTKAYALNDFSWSDVQEYLNNAAESFRSVPQPSREGIEDYKKSYSERRAVEKIIFSSIETLGGKTRASSYSNNIIYTEPFKRLASAAQAYVADVKQLATYFSFEPHVPVSNEDRLAQEGYAKTKHELETDLERVREILREELSFTAYFERESKMADNRRSALIGPQSEAIKAFLSDYVGKPKTHLKFDKMKADLEEKLKGLLSPTWADNLPPAKDETTRKNLLYSRAMVNSRTSLSAVLGEQTLLIKKNSYDNSGLDANLDVKIRDFVEQTIKQYMDLDTERSVMQRMIQNTMKASSNVGKFVSVNLPPVPMQEFFRKNIAPEIDFSVLEKAEDKVVLDKNIERLNRLYHFNITPMDVIEARSSEEGFKQAMEGRASLSFAKTHFANMVWDHLDSYNVAKMMLGKVDYEGIIKNIVASQDARIDINAFLPDLMKNTLKTQDLLSSAAGTSKDESIIRDFLTPFARKRAETVSVSDMKHSQFRGVYETDLLKVVSSLHAIDSLVYANKEAQIENVPTISQAYDKEKNAARAAHNQYRDAIVDTCVKEALDKKLVDQSREVEIRQTLGSIYDQLAYEQKAQQARANLSNSRSVNPEIYPEGAEKAHFPNRYKISAFESGLYGPVGMKDLSDKLADILSQNMTQSGNIRILDKLGSYVSVLDSKSANVKTVSSYMKMADSLIYDPGKRIKANETRIGMLDTLLRSNNLAAEQYEKAIRVEDLVFGNASQCRNKMTTHIARAFNTIADTLTDIACAEEDNYTPSMLEYHKIVRKNARPYVRNILSTNALGKSTVKTGAFLDNESAAQLKDKSYTLEANSVLKDSIRNLAKIVYALEGKTPLFESYKAGLEEAKRQHELFQSEASLYFAPPENRMLVADQIIEDIRKNNPTEKSAEIKTLRSAIDKAVKEKGEVDKALLPAFARLEAIGDTAKAMAEKNTDKMFFEQTSREELERQTAFVKNVYDGSKTFTPVIGDIGKDSIRASRILSSNKAVSQYARESYKDQILQLSGEAFEDIRHKAFLRKQEYEKENKILSEQTAMTVDTALRSYIALKSIENADVRASRDLALRSAAVAKENQNVREAGDAEKQKTLDDLERTYSSLRGLLENARHTSRVCDNNRLLRFAVSYDRNTLAHNIGEITGLGKKGSLYVAQNAEKIISTPLPTVGTKLEPISLTLDSTDNRTMRSNESGELVLDKAEFFNVPKQKDKEGNVIERSTSLSEHYLPSPGGTAAVDILNSVAYADKPASYIRDSQNSTVVLKAEIKPFGDEDLFKSYYGEDVKVFDDASKAFGSYEVEELEKDISHTLAVNEAENKSMDM